MTVSTVGAEIGCNVAWIGCAVEVIDVARAAFTGYVGIIIHIVTGGTVLNIVSKSEWEETVKITAAQGSWRPSWIRSVTACTAGAEVSRYVIRIGSTIEIIDVAGAAFI